MSATKCSTCHRRRPTPSDLAAREAHIDACANPDGACDWGSDVCWGEGWCLIDCRDVFEEYTSVAQALANIGTGVLIAHLAERLYTCWLNDHSSYTSDRAGGTTRPRDGKRLSRGQAFLTPYEVARAVFKAAGLDPWAKMRNDGSADADEVKP